MAAAVASAKRRVVVVCESWLLQEVCLGLAAACGFERLKVDVDTTFVLLEALYLHVRATEQRFGALAHRCSNTGRLAST